MRSRAKSWRHSPAWRPLAVAAAIAVFASAAATPAPGQTARRRPAAVAQTQPTEADVHALMRAMEMQLRLVHRHNLPEYTRRSEQLRAAIAAWQASPRTAADQREITAWLHQSIRDSMPGARHAMPPVPKFAVAPRVAAPPAAATASRSVLRPAPEAPPYTMPTRPTRHETAKATVGRSDIQVQVGVEDLHHAQRIDSRSLFDHHPAADQWPADIPEGDPFVDDPLPE